MASPVATPPLALVIAKHWWVLLVRGLLSIGFGVVALPWPRITLASLVLLYGAYCFAEGLVAFMGDYGRKLWQSMLSGFISIVAGLAAVMYPSLTAIVLLYLVELAMVVSGFPPLEAAARLAEARCAHEGGSRDFAGPPEGGHYTRVRTVECTLGNSCADPCRNCIVSSVARA
jgi:hypothetical protein